MLTIHEEPRSIRRTLRAGEDRMPVLAFGLSMGEDEYSIQVEILDRTYFISNREEAVLALTSFIKEMAELLKEADLPPVSPD